MRLNISASIDGVGDIHDFMRGFEGAYKRAEKSLSKLLELRAEYSNLSVEIEAVITRHNFQNLEDILKQFTPDYISYTPAIASVYSDNLDTIAGVALRPNELKLTCDFLANYSLAHPLLAYYCSKVKEFSIKQRGTFPCLAGYKSLYIDAKGNIYPCHMPPEAYYFGNALSEDTEALFASNRAGDILKNLKQEGICKTCLNNCDIRNLVKEEFFSPLFFLMRNPDVSFRLLREIRKNEFITKQL